MTRSTAKKSVVVYTALFGGYDDLADPECHESEDCDFICFTDNDRLKSGRYRAIVRPNLFLDPARDNRMYKVLAHRYLADYQYSLYVDASVVIRKLELAGLIDRCLAGCDLAVFRHSKRSCLYDEFEVCARKGKDHLDDIYRQLHRYHAEGVPGEQGLTENTVLLRRHNTESMIRFSEAWWREIELGSKRDQLSFAYVAWKQGFAYSLLPGSIKQNDYFVNMPHKLRTGMVPAGQANEDVALRAENQHLKNLVEMKSRRIADLEDSPLVKAYARMKRVFGSNGS